MPRWEPSSLAGRLKARATVAKLPLASGKVDPRPKSESWRAPLSLRSLTEGPDPLITKLQKHLCSDGEQPRARSRHPAALKVSHKSGNPEETEDAGIFCSCDWSQLLYLRHTAEPAARRGKARPRDHSIGFNYMHDIKSWLPSTGMRPGWVFPCSSPISAMWFGLLRQRSHCHPCCAAVWARRCKAFSSCIRVPGS